jgi:hypothetical protein
MKTVNNEMDKKCKRRKRNNKNESRITQKESPRVKREEKPEDEEGRERKMS